jgi:signal peptidase II
MPKFLHYAISPKYAFVVSFAIFLIDQITKFLILAKMPLHNAIEVLPFLDIVHFRNIGSAFGMFKSLGNPFFIAAAAIACVVVSILIIKDRQNGIGYALVLGGAVGNLLDRVAHGSVIDFLYFHIGKHYWPAFNVADSSLTVGVTLLVIAAFFPPHTSS